jgi:hypothetical protein
MFLVGDYCTVLLNSNYDHMKTCLTCCLSFLKVRGKFSFAEILLEENWSSLLSILQTAFKEAAPTSKPGPVI